MQILSFVLNFGCDSDSVAQFDFKMGIVIGVTGIIYCLMFTNSEDTDDGLRVPHDLSIHFSALTNAGTRQSDIPYMNLICNL